MPARQSDIGLLVEPFREKIAALLVALKGQGYHPVLHETLRSAERAEQLVQQGKSKAKGGRSMHCYGLAADIICGDHQWDCRRHQCAFFDALGAQAEDLGLTWGGRWTALVDLPHVQAIPIKLQALARATAPEHMGTLVSTYFAGLLV